MKTMLRNKSFLRIMAGVTIALLFIFLLVTFVFPAGIYSCSDVAAIKGIEKNINQWIEICQLRAWIGTLLALIVFGPAAATGFSIEMLYILLFTNHSLDGLGGPVFFVGTALSLLIQIYLCSLAIFKLSPRK